MYAGFSFPNGIGGKYLAGRKCRARTTAGSEEVFTAGNFALIPWETGSDPQLKKMSADGKVVCVGSYGPLSSVESVMSVEKDDRKHAREGAAE